MPARRIIFINPDASRSGAPMVLLNFMRWIKSSGAEIEMALMLSSTGPMLEDFKQLGPVLVLDQKRLAGKTPLPFKPDLFYYNSVGGSVRGPTMPAGLCPSLCHVHELEYAIQTLTWPTKMPNLLARHDRIIACAAAVRQSLITHRNVPPDRIDLIPEFVPYSEIQSRVAQPGHYESLRREHHLPANALIVGGAGRIEWRKGTDLLVQIAHAVRRKNPELPVYFFWVGGAPASHEALSILHDASHLPALEGRIILVPPQPDPLPTIAGFDLFVLPSREDPLPLVGLEAGACGKPVICFDQAGGMPEFVQNDAGIVVPYLDIDAMADAVIRLLRDPQARATMGQQGNRRVREKHDINVAGPLLLQSVQRAVASI